MLRRGMFVLGASLALAGCGGAGGGGATEAGEVAAQYQGPIQSTDTARGEEVYNSVCMSCHGGGAPNLEGIAWEAAAMRQRIREGGGRMPAIGANRVSDEDLEALLAYLTTIDAVTGGAPAGAEETGAETGGAETEGGEAPAIPDDDDPEDTQEDY